MKSVMKPWGMELIYFDTPYTVKELVINPNCKLSLQYHTKKIETLCLINGNAIVQLGDKTITLEVGEWFHVEAGVQHRLIAGHLGAVFLETALGDDTDIVRIVDDYSRN